MSSTCFQQGSCPVLCCLVPAASLPHGAVSAQPMQMYFMQPVTASIGAEDVGTTPGFAPYSAKDSTQWAAWPVVDTWPNANEQAPPQIPMMTPNVQDFSQARPAQFLMDSDTVSSSVCEEPSTLRRRRPLSCHMQASQAQTLCEATEEVESIMEMPSEIDNDQSQEMARELLMRLEDGGEAQWSALARFQHLAFSSQLSSRAAQLALQDAPAHHAILLASSLQGHVRRAMQSKHANHVVQKIVEVMPKSRAGFVVEELQGFAHQTACHRFGCRLFCRILEHLSPGDQATLDLVDELLTNVDELCSHSFGSYVVRHVLEFGLPEHRHVIAVALLPHAASHAKHRLASHTVEAALKFCSPEDQGALVNALLLKEQVAVLATNQYGRHVVRQLLAMPGPLKQQTEDALRRVEGQLRSSRFGKGVLHSLSDGLKRSRF